MPFKHVSGGKDSASLGTWDEGHNGVVDFVFSSVGH